MLTLPLGSVPIDRAGWNPGALLLLAPSLAIVLCGCGSQTSSATAQAAPTAGAPAKEAIPVTVEPVRLGVASSYYAATSVLEAESRAEVRSRTSGVVTQLFKEEGQRVTEGEVMLLLEDEQPRLRLRQAELEVARARTERERRASMHTAGVLADEDLQTAENEYQKARTEADLARVQVEYTRVAAPFSGLVVRRRVDRGAHVDSGAALFELMDVTPLLTRIHVPANRMGRIAPGQQIELELDSSPTPLRGLVRLVSPIVDETSGTVKVTAAIDDYPVGTRPGDFTRARIVTARHDDALLVASGAIIEEKGEKVVYVVADGVAARRVVEVGFVDGERTEIVSGLQVGDSVVTEGHRGLEDGAPVQIIAAADPSQQSVAGPTAAGAKQAG